MKHILVLIIAFTVTSCVPLSNAPNLEKGKIIRAKRFNNKLPNHYGYIFTDPKNANEFYDYVNTKFQRTNKNSGDHIPIIIDGKEHFISFYETEKSTDIVKLVPIALSVAAGTTNVTAPSGSYISRNGTWYIVLMVTDQDFKDSLDPEATSYNKVRSYLEKMRYEYLNTSNYNQTLLSSQY